MKNRFSPAWLATLMMAPPPAPSREDVALAMLAGIVEADAAAMEANDLVGLGVIPHERYERLAQARDAAIEAAVEWLGRCSGGAER